MWLSAADGGDRGRTAGEEDGGRGGTECVAEREIERWEIR